MEPPIKNPKQFFDSNVPEEIQRRIVRVTLASYRDTRKVIRDQDLPDEEAHDLFPYQLRAHTESGLRNIARLWPNSKATAEPNGTGTAFHTLIQIKNVTMTQSAVETPGTVVRDAAFRNEYADAQSRFVIDAKAQELVVEEYLPPTDATLYGIIIHGPIEFGLGKPGRSQVGFIRVAFPNRDMSGYIDSIDLLARFPDVVAEMADTEVVPDQAQPQLEGIPEFKKREA